MLLVALLGVCALAGAVLGGHPGGPWLLRTAGALGVAHLWLTVHTRRLWESSARRAAYVASHTQGVDVDRAVDAALGAALLALALACWTLVTTTSPTGIPSPGWSRRVAGGCVAVLAAAALAWGAAAGQRIR